MFLFNLSLLYISFYFVTLLRLIAQMIVIKIYERVTDGTERNVDREKMTYFKIKMKIK